MEAILKDLAARHPALGPAVPQVRRAAEMICETFDAGRTLFVCGNGGSGADSEHIAGELLKSFVRKRPDTPEQRARLTDRFGADGAFLADRLERGLPCISLLSHPAFSTAFGNDVDAELVYAQPEREGEAADPSYQRFLPGLGLTKTMLLPHLQEVRDDVLDGLRLFEDITFADRFGRSFYAIPDGSYLLVGDGREELRGEAWLIKDGVMTQASREGEILRL